MNEQNTTELDALTSPQAESKDPEYLAWRDEKVRKALKEAEDHPERRIPQAVIWKKYGLES